MKIKLLILILLLTSVVIKSQNRIQNYIFFNLSREKINEPSFYKNKKIDGAQIKYTWRKLEPEKDKYYFAEIRSDLKSLTKHGKKLFIQIQDVSFDSTIINVPDYIINDPVYNGGIAIQRERESELGNYVTEGWVARRWDNKVAERFHLLLVQLGKQFDGKIAGINLPETSIGFGPKELWPSGFTYDAYLNAIKENMLVLKKSFKKSVAIQYANFMPGDTFPLSDSSYLGKIYSYAAEIGVGMGGPDIKVYKYWQMNHSYKYLKKYTNKFKIGMAVQWGNYEEMNPKTKKEVTIDDIYKFASEEIGADFIFWCTQEPYYSKNLIPYLNNQH